MVKKINEEQFVSEAKKSAVAVVDFSATWCGPCRMLAPVVEALSDEFAGQVDFNAAFVRIDFNGVVNRRQFIFREFYVKRRPDYLRYETNIFCGHIKVIGVKQC